MSLATFAAVLCLCAPAVNEEPIKCAVMGSPTKATSAAIEYAGVRLPICCGGCASPLLKEPTKYLKDAAKETGVVAAFMFCPVSGEKLDLEKAKETVDYNGVRYAFCCADCKGIFEKDAAKYAKTPEKESMVCAVSGEKIDAYSHAGGFVDHDGVRYYTCCADCLAAFKKDPAGMIAKGKAKVAAPAAMTAPKAKEKG